MTLIETAAGERTLAWLVRSGAGGSTSAVAMSADKYSMIPGSVGCRSDARILENCRSADLE
eukprot:scaffold9509_cov126-Isochrysis_galbana.AAC.1